MTPPHTSEYTLVVTAIDETHEKAIDNAVASVVPVAATKHLFAGHLVHFLNAVGTRMDTTRMRIAVITNQDELLDERFGAKLEKVGSLYIPAALKPISLQFVQEDEVNNQENRGDVLELGKLKVQRVPVVYQDSVQITNRVAGALQQLWQIE